MLAALIAVYAALPATVGCIISSGAEYMDLAGNWSAANANRSYVVPATVPGFIQNDLYHAGVLPNPVYGTNFNGYNWVPQEDWTFNRSFPASSPDGTAWTDFKKVYAFFEGIDTAAQVSVNGMGVGTADNMFRQWIFDVTAALSSGGQSIAVQIFSPIKTALNTLAQIGAPYTVFTNYAVVYPEGRQFIRKVQSDFGWDWGPHFAPSGIYRNVHLVGLNDGILVTNSFIDIFKDGQYPNIEPPQTGPWIVNVSVDFMAASAGQMWEFSTEIEGFCGNSTVTATAEGPNRAWLNFTIPEEAVERWWPHTAGRPRLYTAYLSLSPTSSDSGSPAQWSKPVGFRTITLDLAPDPSGGYNFHFVVNGQTINAKGSNMVPLDPFEQDVTPQDYQWLINSSVASNFNMLRVWSSGNYYGEDFYDAADRAGIMLWNEFQFSDNFYPGTSEFLSNVAEEARYQIRRLNHHPSMALWCGGNELTKFREIAAKNATYGASWIQNLTLLQQDTLWPSVYGNTRSVSWLQASDAPGYISYDPYTGDIVPNNAGSNSTAGPREDYNLGLDTVFNSSYLPASRFMVEYGAISYDSYASFETVFEPSDISPNGTDLLSRCYDGGSTIYQDTANGIARYFVLPNKAKASDDYAAAFFWSSQIWQGEIIKFKTESYRRGIGLPQNDLGALVWQLNAPWTTTALNSIEKTGRWKVLQYLTKQTFEPVVVSSWFEPLNSTYNVWVASDSWDTVQGQVEATWYDWSSNVLSQCSWPFELSPLDSQPLWNATGWESILPSNATADNSVLLLRLEAKDTNGTAYQNSNYFVPNYTSNSTLVDPGLQVEYLGDSLWNVTATRGIAAYTWLETPSSVVGYFTDNSMWLSVGESRIVGFTQRGESNPDEWGEQVTVRSIWNNLGE